MSTYTTRAEAVEQAILPALGEWADDYDVDALADEVLEWHDERNADGDVVLPRCGFRMRCHGEDFWAAASRHDNHERN